MSENTMTPKSVETSSPREINPTAPARVLPRKKERAAWIWTVVIVAALGAAVWWWVWTPATDAKSARGVSTGPKTVPVVVATAHTGDVPIYLTGLGTVTALNTVTVRTRVDGEIDKVAFTEGQLVKQGDLLAEIDPRPFKVQLTQAEGQLARDQALLKNAELDLERDKQAADAIPQQQIATQEALVAQDQAAVKIDQGLVASAELNLTYSRITAPIPGRIGLRMVDQGNIVHATDTSGLAVITQLQPISVIFSLPQDDIPQLTRRLAQSDSPSVEAYDRGMMSKLATGTVLALDNQVDPTSGTVRVKAQFSNQDFTLFPNQFVNARLLVDTLKAAVIVPAAAVQRGPDTTFVYVVQADETVTVRSVVVGHGEGDFTAIESGLKAGEIVVTDGVDKLQDGTKVTTRSGVTTKAAAGKSVTTRSAANRSAKERT